MQTNEGAFFAFMIIALLAVLGSGMLPPAEAPTGLISRAVPAKVRQTVVITGIDLNDRIGEDIEVLTGRHLSSLASGRISTQAGQTVYNQILRLRESGTPTLNGGVLTFGKDEKGNVDDFVMWQANQPLFEFELEFNPGLEGELSGTTSDDLEGESLLLLGRPAYITRVDASGTKIKIRLFTGSGEVEFEDNDVTDNSFEQGVEMNGRGLDAQVRIKGRVTSTRVKIFSIEYRPDARNRISGDIYVTQHRGLRGYLMEPEALLNPGFDIIYGGMSGGLERAATSTMRRGYVPSGNRVHFRPSGGDQYRLQFTNNRGKMYVIPAYVLVGGSLKLGDEGRDLVVKEGNNNADFNIDVGDYFVVSSGTSTSSDTNVLRLQSVTGDRIFFDDLAGGSYEEHFEASGEGVLSVGGRNYAFVADPTNERIVVDQTGDGGFGGDRARLILSGGAQLELFTASAQLRIPKKLFKDDQPSGDQVTTINLFEDDGDIDLDVPTQSTVDLEKGVNRVKTGMTTFGTHFALSETRTPADLVITVPTGQVGARAFVADTTSTGQTRGWVVITTERERFLRE
ncbi:MAG: hypothetical protein ACE5FT_01290 [Candidatus Nanoarchaeia archaeon]